MSDSFKTAMRGYDKQDVDGYISEMMAAYREEVDKINQNISYYKEENNGLKSNVDALNKRTPEDVVEALDKNLKIRLKMLESKIKEKDAQCESLLKAKEELELIIEREVSQKNSSADEVLSLMEKKRSECEIELMALKESGESAQSSERLKSGLITKINMIEEQIEQAQFESHAFSQKKVNELIALSEDKDQALTRLKHRLERAHQGACIESFENEKHQIADILLDAQQKAVEITQSALREKEALMDSKSQSYFKEEQNLKSIERKMLHILDSINYAVVKMNDNGKQAVNAEQVIYPKLEVL